MRPRRRKSRRLITFLFFVLFAAVVFSVVAALPAFRIESVEAAGARLLPPEEAIRIANIPLSESIFLVRLSGAKKRLMQVPVVKDVSFKRVLPSKIRIILKERKETVVCVLKNQSLILDNEGVILNPKGSGIAFPDITGLPVMSGIPEWWIENGLRISSGAGKDVLTLLSEFENFIMPQRLQIDVSDVNNVKLIIDDVLNVHIGQASDLREKMKVFEAIYSRIRDKKNQVDYINISSYQFPAVKFK